MDYKTLIRSLELPDGYVAPDVLGYGNITARALSRADLVADVTGINSSLDIIRQTRGGAWPTGPVTEAFDFVDLVWHEHEFRENYSFAYAIYDEGDQYVGCCYLYPMGRRTPLNDTLLHHDVDVSWWVTTDAYQRGYYANLYLALGQWIADSFPFTNPYYSNREIP